MRVEYTLLIAGSLIGSAGAGELPDLAEKPPTVYKTSLRVRWTGEDSQFWYRNDLAGDRREFVLVNPAVGTLKRFAPDQWEERALPRKRKRRISTDRNAPSGRTRSPDGKWQAFAEDDDLWIRNRESGATIRLTDTGTEQNTFRFDVIQDRAISMRYSRLPEATTVPDVYWSPDSKRLVALQTKVVKERKVFYVEATPKDQLQPALQSYPYLKPGDPIPERQPHLFDIEKMKSIPIDPTRFEQAWRLTKLRWLDDASRFTFLFNQRGHQTLRLLAINAVTGDVHTMVEEKSDTFIDYAYKTYLHFTKEQDELIWMSERDGWNHLYLYAANGKLRNRITRGDWMVRKVTHVDEEQRQIWFDAMGVKPGQDPYYVHHCRVSFDGSGFAVLTSGHGTHEVEFSPDRSCFIDKWSRVDLPPVHALRHSTDGKLITELEKADVQDWKAAGNEFPTRFVAKGRDGKTDIHGVIQRPANFDPSMKYPVVEYIYAGPHSFYAPKSFRSSYTHRRDLLARGFVVVQMDGMGTNWRGKKFHDVCWHNLGDAGFPDRIAWMKAAAKSRPWMDLSRVGIYGGSAGGQNAMRALIAHSGFYHAAAADCGCHDNRMDKIWWNEAWMGWPIGDHYGESSNVAQAHRLKGELLLMLGGEDRNVDPASTIQAVDALVKAGKDFEFVLQPSGGHGSAESTYGKKRRLDFFIRHLRP